MQLENVVLVRARNNVPLNGELIPSCDGKYLIKDHKSDYYYIIKRIVKRNLETKENRLIEEWVDADRNLIKEEVQKYLPYTSLYTSTLSFSLNGLVPDDINNTFSNMNLAVLEPIKYHVKENFVNIDVIDTTIKGSITLSSDAILVINENYYNSLTDEVKENLKKFYKIELFSGSLKDAVSKTLTKYNYPSLPLIQKKDEKNISNCIEKESMIDFQKKFAEELKVSRLNLQQLYTYPISGMDEVDSNAALKVKDDIEKIEFIEKYYRNLFYSFLLTKANLYEINLSDEEVFYLFSDYSNKEEVVEKLVKEIINLYGLEKIKEIVDEFNNNVLENYLTNNEIINQNNMTR